MARGPPVYVPDLHNATPGLKTPKLSFHNVSELMNVGEKSSEEGATVQVVY